MRKIQMMGRQIHEKRGECIEFAKNVDGTHCFFFLSFLFSSRRQRLRLREGTRQIRATYYLLSRGEVPEGKKKMTARGSCRIDRFGIQRTDPYNKFSYATVRVDSLRFFFSYFFELETSYASSSENHSYSMCRKLRNNGQRAIVYARGKIKLAPRYNVNPSMVQTKLHEIT